MEMLETPETPGPRSWSNHSAIGSNTSSRITDRLQTNAHSYLSPERTDQTVGGWTLMSWIRAGSLNASETEAQSDTLNKRISQLQSAGSIPARLGSICASSACINSIQLTNPTLPIEFRKEEKSDFSLYSKGYPSPV